MRRGTVEIHVAVDDPPHRNAQPETLLYGDLTDEPLRSEQNNGSTYTRYINGVAGDMIGTFRHVAGAPDLSRLQLTNLHGDVIGEIPNAPGTTPPVTWETDEYGIPRKPVRPAAITQVGQATSTALATPGQTLAIARPEGVQEGDTLLVGIANGVGSTVTTPPGWTRPTGGVVTNANTTYSVYWHTAAADEPSTYSFGFSLAGEHRGGILALRNADPSNPVLSSTTASGSTENPAVPWGAAPTKDNLAQVLILGNNAGDGDAAGSWDFPSPFTEAFDTSTGTETTDRNLAAAVNILINGKGIPLPNTTVTNQTGHPAAPWGAIAVLVAPKPPDTEQYRYRYLGAKQRPLDLPAGTIAMGARAYVPQLGRFLQTDPAKGGSCNSYDYVCGDPVNSIDLDGLAKKRRRRDCLKTCIGVAFSKVSDKCATSLASCLTSSSLGKAVVACGKAAYDCGIAPALNCVRDCFLGGGGGSSGGSGNKPRNRSHGRPRGRRPRNRCTPTQTVA